SRKKQHRQQRMSLRSEKKHRQQRRSHRSFPLQKRTLKKASITNPKCSPVSATITAMGTRWVTPENTGTAQEVLFSNDPPHVIYRYHGTRSRYLKTSPRWVGRN